MPVVGKLHIHNSGNFVVGLGVKWIYNNQEFGPAGAGDNRVGEGGSHTLDPGDYNVPDGSIVWAYVDVVWGDDRQGSPQDGGGMVFKLADEHVGEYKISGVTFDTHFKFEGITPPE